MTRTATRPWLVFGPPVVAALVSFFLAGVVGVSGSETSLPDGLASLLLVLALPLSFLVPALWAWVQLTASFNRSVFFAAAVILALILGPFEGVEVLQIGELMAAGILAGMALRMRWRLDLALVLVALFLSPALIWTTLETPVSEQFQMVGDQLMGFFQENMPEGADEKQQALALDAQRQQWDDFSAWAETFYVPFMAVGFLGQAGVILALALLVAKLQGLVVGLTGLRPFLEWRVPFYVVWVLVVGIGLFLTRQAVLVPAGLTLMVLAAVLLSVHGFAIQVFLTSRAMSGPGRVVFWLVIGVFFWYVLLISGLLLGLADQWIDLRRHIAAAGPPSDGQR